MNPPISKRADISNIVDKYISTVWKSEDGFFENLFRIGTYLSPFLGIGWVPLLLSGLGSAFLGVGISDVGRWVDQKLGISPGEAPPVDWESKLTREIDLLTQGFSHNAYISSRQMTKEASIFSAILKSGKIAGLIVKGVGRLITALLGVYGLATINDLVHKLGKPVREQVQENAPEYLSEVTEQAPQVDIDDMADYIEQKYGLK